MSKASMKTVESRHEPDALRAGVVRVTRARKGTERVSLRSLREAMGKTQGEIAAALETDQGEVSRMERRPDVMLSTLRRYAAALGGTCEVMFVFSNGRRILIADSESNDSPK